MSSRIRRSIDGAPALALGWARRGGLPRSVDFLRAAGALALLLTICGCGKHAGSDASAGTAAAENEFGQPATFAGLYATQCAGCHGADGKLGPAPPLNDAIFLAIVSDEDLREVIERGRPGTPMPAFGRAAGGTLDEAAVGILASGIKPRWRGSAPPARELPRYKAEPAAETSAAHDAGILAYNRACAECHGPATTVAAESEHFPAIRAGAFLALISDQALRRIIITGRPDLGMPDFAGSAGRGQDFQPLTEQEIADLNALLAAWRAEAGESR